MDSEESDRIQKLKYLEFVTQPKDLESKLNLVVNNGRFFINKTYNMLMSNFPKDP